MIDQRSSLTTYLCGEEGVRNPLFRQKTVSLNMLHPTSESLLPPETIAALELALSNAFNAAAEQQQQQAVGVENVPAMLTAIAADLSRQADTMERDAAVSLKQVETPPELTTFDDYVELHRLKAMLLSGDLVLVKASYLLELSKSDAVLPRRQDLPDSALVDAMMLQRIIRELELWDSTSDMFFTGLVVISYAWGHPDHPDPHKQLLQNVLAPAIEWYMSERAAFIVNNGTRDDHMQQQGRWWNEPSSETSPDFGIFLDFCSMFQKPRAKSEDAAFRRTLNQMDILYAHQRTVKWRLTRQQEGATGHPYGMRGWPYFETNVSWLISDQFSVLNLGQVDFLQPIQYEVFGGDW